MEFSRITSSWRSCVSCGLFPTRDTSAVVFQGSRGNAFPRGGGVKYQPRPTITFLVNPGYIVASPSLNHRSSAIFAVVSYPESTFTERHTTPGVWASFLKSFQSLSLGFGGARVETADVDFYLKTSVHFFNLFFIIIIGFFCPPLEKYPLFGTARRYLGGL